MYIVNIQGVQEKVKKVITLFDTKIRLNSYFLHENLLIFDQNKRHKGLVSVIKQNGHMLPLT